MQLIYWVCTAKEADRAIGHVSVVQSLSCTWKTVAAQGSPDDVDRAICGEASGARSGERNRTEIRLVLSLQELHRRAAELAAAVSGLRTSSPPGPAGGARPVSG